MGTEILDKKYLQYNDYYFKSILQKRANGLLDFVKIPFRITKVLVSEYNNLGPHISRLDFVGEAVGENQTFILILECQTNLPTDDDIRRFFQYVASLHVFKDNNVELFILCTEKSKYTKRDFVINSECTYTMHMISLKDFKAKNIFKNIENKLKNNDEITDEDIASLQLIIYTDFDESDLEILNRARELIEQISERMVFDINEKMAIIYLFDMLSTNMLSADDYDEYMEVNSMLVNPRERYFKNKGIEEGIDLGKRDVAQKLLQKGFSMDEVVKLTGLSKEVILNAK